MCASTREFTEQLLSRIHHGTGDAIGYDVGEEATGTCVAYLSAYPPTFER